jgi:4'-phosphopantetheinyl transferase
MPIDLETPAPEETPVWLPQATAPPLAEGDLHLWRIPIGTPNMAQGPGLEPYRELLGEDQRARALRITRMAGQARYVQAQAGLRRILGLYLGTQPQSLSFRYGPFGKPFLGPAPSGFEFNLTTADDWALVGVSLGSPLGVDCERVRPRRGLEAIARRMFSPEHAAAIAALPKPAGLVVFYRAWTALEADAKADGRGLFRPRPAGACPPEVRHFVPAQGYMAAVARAEVPPLGNWRTLQLRDRSVP